MWQFLKQLGGAADPLGAVTDTQVFETYPVLAMIALGWMLADKRVAGRLPKYNPERRRTFSIDDWQYVCGRLLAEITLRNLSQLGAWIISKVKEKQPPRKEDQDCLDACICLMVALHLVESKNCLMVGDTETGYIVVPHGDDLRRELERRCTRVNRDPSLQVRAFKWNASQ
ncbi:MAG: DUF429 domain-containing protein [Desulfobulbaceae bacterium]